MQQEERESLRLVIYSILIIILNAGFGYSTSTLSGGGYEVAETKISQAKAAIENLEGGGYSLTPSIAQPLGNIAVSSEEFSIDTTHLDSVDINRVAEQEENVFTLGKKNVDIYDNSNYVGKATKYNIEKFLGDDLPNKVKEEDSVLVFFSGHGITIDVNDGNIKRKQGFLVPIDGKKKSPFATCVSMDVITQLSEIIPARQILFVIDSCNSGIVLTRNKGDSKKDNLDQLVQSFIGRTRQAITAGRSTQISKISSKYSQSIYTYHLVKGLEGKADANKDSVISIHELHNYVRTQVSKETSNQQIPQMGGLKNTGEGDFFFILK